MSRSVESLCTAFRKDSMEELTPACLVDYGFMHQEDENFGFWFALLKDWRDILVQGHGETKAKDVMHKAAITGTIVEEMEKQAQKMGQRWTRWADADESKLQAVLSAARNTPYK